VVEVGDWVVGAALLVLAINDWFLINRHGRLQKRIADLENQLIRERRGQ